MREGEASGTALRVAMQRAAHQLIDDPIVFADGLAVPILGAGAEEKLHGTAADYRAPAALPFRGTVIARSRFCLDCTLAAVARGVRQVVILGAGLDTTAYRGVLPAGAKVYEVDHPATQAWKKEMLRAAGIPIPPSTVFIPIDFDQTPLLEGLDVGGFDLTQPTFFSWIGVSYYLDADGVQATLKAVGSLAAGGEIVFDYFEPTEKHRDGDLPGFKALGVQFAAGGEPWKSYFEPAHMAAILNADGFAPVEDVDCPAMAERYFAGRTDGLVPGPPARFVSARIA